MSDIINDICGDEVATVLNPGGQKQCPPKPAFALIMAKENQEFATTTVARTKTAFDAAKATKDIIPLYKIEEVNPNNTEEKKYEGRHEEFVTDPAIKGVDYNHIIGDCSYEMLKSLKNSGYTRVYRVLTDGTFHAELQSDGKVKGEPISSYNVGTLIESLPGGKPQNADISLKFKDYKKSTIKPDFDIKKYEGIYNVGLVLVNQTAGELKIKLTAGCSGSSVESFEDGNVVHKNAAGVVQAITWGGYDADNGYYVFTGAFATGDTIEINGVIIQTNYMFEGTNILTLT